MSDLRQIQEAFQRYLTDDHQDIKGYVVSSAHAQAEHRLATYFNAYRARLIESLGVNYPIVRTLLGEQQFEALAIEYLQTYPSANFSVRWFGDKFSEFLATKTGSENFDLMSEVALFEWLRSAVFDERHGHSLVGLEDMARLPAEQWPQLRFTFKPAIRLVDFSYNVPLLASAQEQEKPLPELTRQKHPTRWLIWRKQLDIYWRSLPADEAWALQKAMQGDDFSCICDGLVDWVETEQIALRAAGLAKQWIHDQLITNLQ